VHAFRSQRHDFWHRVSRPALATAAGDACGVQAQVLSAAGLSLRARVKGLTAAAVDRALLRDRTLVKAWLMRGTLHLLPADEFPAYVGALRQAADARAWERKLPDLLPGYLRRRGMRPGDVAPVVRAITEALGDDPLTRTELADRVTDRVGAPARPWIEHSWGGIVRLASLHGAICFGPSRGREITFVRAAAWLRDFREMEGAPAEDAFVRRYLRAFGPATPRDMAVWSGIPAREIERMWTGLGDDLAVVSVEGAPAHLLADDVEALRRAPLADSVVRLLPHFETYLLGHRDKSHLVDAAHYKRVYRKAGWLTPVVLVDGRVAAIWSHRHIGDRWRITVEPFRRLAREEREGIATEAEDIGRFLGGGSEVAYGTLRA